MMGCMGTWKRRPRLPHMLVLPPNPRKPGWPLMYGLPGLNRKPNAFDPSNTLALPASGSRRKTHCTTAFCGAACQRTVHPDTSTENSWLRGASGGAL